MKICLFLILLSTSTAKEFFPDKTSVITNENLSFYQRDDFYLITVPCAIAALFLVCCVLCCTLYAREGVCHLFDFPDELRRHASGEHFLTVEEFLELERRHRLGLPVDSLLELQERRRSEAEGGVPQSGTDNGETQAGLEEYPRSSLEYGEYMSGPADANVSSSAADLRSSQPKWSAPQMRRSMSLDRTVERATDGVGYRSVQDVGLQDTPASPTGSPLRYNVPASQQGSEHHMQTLPADQWSHDHPGQYVVGSAGAQPIPIPLTTAEDIKRMRTEDSGYPTDYRRLGQPQENVEANRVYVHRSDPELSRYATDGGYGIERAVRGSDKTTDEYNQWSSRGMLLDGTLPPPEAHRSPTAAFPADQHDLTIRDRPDQSPLTSGAERQGFERQGMGVGRRYHGHPSYGPASATAIGGSRVPFIDGAMMMPPEAKPHRGGYELDVSPLLREQVRLERRSREDLRGIQDNQQMGVRAPHYSSPHEADQPIPLKESRQHDYSVDQVENRHEYLKQDPQGRTPSVQRMANDRYDFSSQGTDAQRYRQLSRDVQMRAYDDDDLPQKTSRGYHHVEHDFPAHPEVLDFGYQQRDVPSRAASRLSISRQRPSRSYPPESDASYINQRSDGHTMAKERNMMDPLHKSSLAAADLFADQVEGFGQDKTGRETAIDVGFEGSSQWITGADGKQYLVTIQSRHGATAPSTPTRWSEMRSPQLGPHIDGVDGSRIFSHTKIPLGIYGEAADAMGLDKREHSSPRFWQAHDEARADSSQHRSRLQGVAAEQKKIAGSSSHRDDRQPEKKPSSLLQRVRSVSVSRMSHSLRQMVAGGRQPSSRSRSEEPRDSTGNGPRGSAAWLLHRIRSLRGVSEQPTVSPRRKQQERRSDRRSRARRHQDSPAGSEGGVSGAQDWPSSVEDLEEGEYVSPSRQERTEGSRHPTPQAEEPVEIKREESQPDQPQKPSPKHILDSEKSDNALAERQPSPEPEPVQYVLEEREGRKRIISVSADRPERSRPPPSKAFQPSTTDKRGVSDSSAESDKEISKKKVHKKRRDKSSAKHQRSTDSATIQPKKKKAKAKKKKKKNSRKRSKSSISASSSDSSSYEESTKKSKRHRATLCMDNEQSDSDNSQNSDESSGRSYEDSQFRIEVENGSHSSRSASRESHRSAEQHHYQGRRDNRFSDRDNRFSERDNRFNNRDNRFSERDNRFSERNNRFNERDSRFSERTDYRQQTWRPRPNYYNRRYRPRQFQTAMRGRWNSRSPAPRSPGRSRTPPDREPTPERGRSELNRHGQPRHRPVVFQNESLRAFVSQPSRHAFEQRGRPPRSGRGTLPAALRRPFQTNQSFIPWQQYPDSPQPGRGRDATPDRPGPRTPPLPPPSSPRQGPGDLSPSTTPPRPPPMSSPARLDPRTRPARGDPRLGARSRSAHAAAAARESQIRRAVYGEMSEEDVGCVTKLKRLFDE